MYRRRNVDPASKPFGLRARALWLALAVVMVASAAVVVDQLPLRAATTATFVTTADAQVQQANASTNYGTSTTVRVDSHGGAT